MLDALIFRLWDRYWLLRPHCVCLVNRLDVRLPAAFRALYYARVLGKASPRVWRYLARRRPDVVFLWRMGLITETARMPRWAFR